MTPEQKQQVNSLRLVFAMERRTQYLGRDDDVAAELRKLQAQVEELQADAERYRMKREIDREKMLQGIDSKDSDLIEIACIGFDASYDAAIDAALAARKAE